MRSIFLGGETVAAGLYFSFTALGFVSIPREGGVLPEGHRSRYFRTPALLVVLLAPLFGITLVVLLPLTGVFVLALAVWGRLGRGTDAMRRFEEREPASDPSETPATEQEPLAVADGEAQLPEAGADDKRDEGPQG